MSLPATRYIRPDEYLSFERLADTKHEYVAGLVYPRDDPDHPVDPDVVLGLRPESRKSMAGGTVVFGPDDSVWLESLGVTLEFSAIYKDVLWDVEAPEAEEYADAG